MSSHVFPLAGLPGDVGRKVYTAGTHRVVSPAETLARFRPLGPAMGITRVGMITGLDVLGIPVAFATRPNSRSIAVFQGKGLTDDAARASAFMEAAELWHAENILLPCRLASAADLRAAGITYVVEGLTPAGPDALPDGRAIPWLEAHDLVAGTPVQVPYEVVSCNYTAPVTAATGALFQATTNGLASGNSLAEGVAHGLYEIIERDAITLWMARRDDETARRAIDPDTVDDPACRGLIDLFRSAGVALRIWDVTSDIGLPVFVCLAADQRDSATDPEIGSGCHASRSVALLRAITEAAQSRTTWIAGARDDLAPDLYTDERRRRRARASSAWLEAKETNDFRNAPDVSGDSLHEDLCASVRALASAGLQRVLIVDVTRPELGLPVARVIVPGLEGAVESDDERPQPGARARRQEARP
jgi:ribosomal protein S12 methylthiotransferase accessory factor